MNFKKIEKQEIVNLHFHPFDVLENERSKKERDNKLLKAAILGNIEKEKCKIVFCAKEGWNCVETTVWAVTDEYVCLKGGISLLIASISEVILL